MNSDKFKVTKTALDGVVIIEPKVFGDERGNFSESFSEREFAHLVAPVHFVQDNQSTSRRGVVRGLHFQKAPDAQAKLVRVACGRILDVAVDMRSGSATYGQWVAVELSARNGRQLFVPRGFAHGFSVLGSEGTETGFCENEVVVCGDGRPSGAGTCGRGGEAVVIYKVDGYYAPESDGGVRWNDPELGIDWGVDPSEAIVSEKDAALPLLADAYKF